MPDGTSPPNIDQMWRAIETLSSQRNQEVSWLKIELEGCRRSHQNQHLAASAFLAERDDARLQAQRYRSAIERVSDLLLAGDIDGARACCRKAMSD